MPVVPVTLGNLKMGAIEEMFQEEIEKVLKNIDDPNTAAKTKRTIVLKVEIKPNERREMGNVLITASSKLAPVSGVDAVLYFGQQGGRLIATEAHKEQKKLELHRTAAGEEV